MTKLAVWWHKKSKGHLVRFRRDAVSKRNDRYICHDCGWTRRP